jgi:DNA repair exonuclease SbcCD ATPase subunit
MRNSKGNIIIKKKRVIKKNIVKPITNVKDDDISDEIVILDDIGSVEYIHHMADIHIPLEIDRMIEYELVFNKLFNKIKESVTNPEKSLIVVAGDIFDSKEKLNPESINLAKNFFIGLTDICPCVVTIGNHDQHTLATETRMNSLEPIITNRFNTKHKLHFIKNTGHYQYKNLLIGLTAMGSKSIFKPIKTDLIKVGLYHGIIFGSMTELGRYFKEKGYFTTRDFEGYDYVLLGDVHKFQYLNDTKSIDGTQCRPKDTIAYPSSLVQKTFGEDLVNHGYITWDLVNKTSKFNRIPNDYGFVIINYDKNGHTDLSKIEIPKYPRFSIKIKDVDYKKVVDLKNMLKSKFNAISIEEELEFSNMGIDLGNVFGTKDINSMVIKDSSSLIQILKKAIKDNNIELTKIENDRCMSKIEEIIKELDINFDTKTKNIKLKQLQFDNFFCYGADNIVNYEKFNGIMGLVQENCSGKSSLVDLILFSLYGTSSRSNNILNIKCNSGKTIIVFDVNGIEYTIRRHVTLTKSNKTTQEVSLFEKDKLLYKSTNTPEIDKEISKIIGSYDDMVNLNIIVQQCQNIVDMDPKTLKNFISKMLKLDIFDEINVRATKKARSTRMEINGINKVLKYKTQTDLEAEEIKLKKLGDDLKYKQDCLVQSKKKYETINDTLLALKTKTAKYDINNFDETKLTELQKLKDKYLAEVSSLNAKIKGKSIEILPLTVKLNDINKKIKQLDIENTKKSIELFETNKKNKITELRYKLNNLYKSKEKVQYSSTVELAKLIATTNAILKEIDDDLSKNNIIINKITKKYNNIEEEYQNLEGENEIITEEINKLNKEISDISNKINSLSNHKFNPLCKACMNNTITKDKINYQNILNKYNSELTEKRYNLVNINFKMSKMFNHYSKYIEITSNITNLSEEREDSETRLNNLENDKLKLTNNIKIDKEIKLVELDLDKTQSEENSKAKEYETITRSKLEIQNMINLHENTKAKLGSDVGILEKKLIDYDHKINKFEEIKEFINENKTLISDIESETELKNDTETEMEEIQKDINIINKQIIELDVTIKNDKDNHKIINTLKNDNIGYETIVKLFDQGIMATTFQTNIRNLENTINNLLSMMCHRNLRVKLEYDDKKLKMFKSSTGDNFHNINTACGYERFIINLCMRIALNSINNLIKFSGFIIDEGLSCIDIETRKDIDKLIKQIKSIFKWCLIITHLEDVRGHIENIIPITKKEGFSKVNYV